MQAFLWMGAVIALLNGSPTASVDARLGALPKQAVADSPLSAVANLPMQAEADSAATVVGRYVFVPEASDDTRRAVERATARLNAFTRSAARDRLYDATEPPPTLQIEALPDGPLRITRGSRPPQSVQPGAGTTTQTGPDGGSVEVSARYEGSALVVTGEGRRARRTETFTPRGRDQLVLTVVIENGSLSAPLRYTLVYRRAA